MRILLLAKSETMANISDQQPKGKANQITTKKSYYTKEATKDKSKSKKEGFHTFIIVVFCLLPRTFECQLKGLTRILFIFFRLHNSRSCVTLYNHTRTIIFYFVFHAFIIIKFCIKRSKIIL